ncbi:MAG TPA: DUF11 domain-containing protein [Vicinamibacterales bacterium]
MAERSHRHLPSRARRAAVIAWLLIASTAGAAEAQGPSPRGAGADASRPRFDVEISPEECRIGARTSELPVRDACAWTAPTAFELTWTADELRLTVGDTTLTKSGSWTVNRALHIFAAGNARVTVATVGDNQVGKSVTGRPQSGKPVELTLTKGRNRNGWTIAGTIERLASGNANDGVQIGLDSPDDDRWDGKLWATSAAAAGPFAFGGVGANPLGSPRSAGRTLTWTGNVSNLWSQPANWNPAGPPAPGDNLVFPSGTGATITNNDAGAVPLGGISVQTGTYQIQGGGLTLGNGSASDIQKDFRVDSLAGSGNISIVNQTSFSVGRENTPAAPTTFSGTITGSKGTLVKDGPGMITFTGDASNLVATNVREGTFVLNGGSLSQTTVTGPGVFAMPGGKTGDLDVRNSGQFGNGGVGIGATGNLQLEDSAYIQTIGGTSPGQFQQLKVTGGVRVSYNGNTRLTVQLANGYVPPAGATIIMVDNDGADPVQGIFQGQPEGSTITTTGGVTFKISYVAGTGNDIGLTVVSGGSVPDLTITKSQSGSFVVGQPGGTYTLTVSNVGKAATSGTVTVTDMLPTGFTPTNIAATGWSCQLTTPVTCTRGDALSPDAQHPSITITVQIASTVSPSTVTNTATVSGGGDANSANNSASVQTSVVAAPATIDLAMTKTAQGPFTPGGQAVYSLVVANSSSSTGPSTGQITVTDTLPSDLANPSANGPNWSCAISGLTVTCTRADALAPGGSFPPIKIIATISPTAAASITNTATVSGGGETTPGSNNSSTIVTPISAGPADLSITKTHADPFTQGQTGATFTINVTNGATAGPTNGTTVTVTDTLPTGLTATGAAGSGWTCSIAPLITCNRSDVLDRGQSYPAIILTVNVAANASSGSNLVTVSGGGDVTPGNNSATDPVTVAGPTPVPDLTIHKSHSGNVVQGGSVAFTIAARNVGAAPTSGDIVVTDTLPDGLAPSSADGQGWRCAIAGQVVTCRRVDAFAPSSPLPPITLNATVSRTATSTVNIATVSGGGDASTGNNSSSDAITIGAASPDLAIAKSHQGSFNVGQQNVPFTIDVSNVGNGATTGTVTVTDQVPPGLAPVSATGTGWTCSVAVQTTTCNRSDALAPNGHYPSITLRVNVLANAASSENVAAVAGGGDSNDANNTAHDAYIVVGVPNLSINKTHSGNFTQGRPGTYLITVSNVAGAQTAGEVVVQDTLPELLVPTSASGAGWTCALQGQVATCRRSDVLAGNAAWPQIALAINVLAAPGTLTNVATVSGGGDVSPDNNTHADSTTIVGLPQLTILKSHAGTVVQGDQGLQFKIDVTNNGNASTTGAVTVTDALPAGLIPVDAVGAGWTCGFSGATATCSRSDGLAAGAFYPSIRLTVNVAADAVSTSNQARVDGGGDTTPNDNVSTDNVPIAPPNKPNLVLTKSHTGNFFQGQQGAAYRLRVGNLGQAPSTGQVVVSDDVPVGLVPTSASGTGWSCTITGQVAACTRSDALASGAYWPDITLIVNVAMNAASVVNIATISGGGDVTSTDNGARDATTVDARAPNLTVTKKHADPFTGGQSGAAYHITVSNVGGGPTVGEVVVTDTVPSVMTPTSASGSGWSCGIQTQVVTCRRSDPLGPGASYPDITLLVNVAPNATSVSNVVTVSGGGDAHSDDNVSSDYTSVNAAPDPTIALSLSTPLLFGSDADYIATVRNLGPGRVGGTTRVVANLPDGLVPVAGIGAGWACDVEESQVVCSTPNGLDANAEFPSITVRGRVAIASGDVTVGATVFPAQDIDTSNNQALVTNAASVPTTGLTITKTASTDHVAIGGSVTYLVTVTNVGDVRLDNVIVRDLPPRGFERVQSSTLQSTNRSTRQVAPVLEAGSLTFALGALQPQDVATLVYRVIVGADARTGRQDNRATVTGTNPIGRTALAGPAIASVDVTTDTFTMLQALVGRVYEDVDGDGQFTDADRPVPNARVITSTGQAAITDSAGLYNIPSLGAGSVAVSLDRDTVPGQLTTADDGPGGQSWTRLIRTPIGGGTVLHQNYALKRAEGRTDNAPPLVEAKTNTPPSDTDLMPERAAGAIPPRREYETRQGSSMLIALGEVSFGQAAPEFGLFEKDQSAWGYGSIFYQGDLISPENRLTLAYDSHRHINGTTDRDRLFELDPNDRVYPVFGDSSQRQEFATSNANVFARLERGNSHVMYGDLIGDLPSSDRDGGRWSSYQRHLTGGEVRIADAKGDHVTVRGAQPTTAYARDTFAGTTLGLIALSFPDIVTGTETVAVETRDRRMPDRLLSREVLARGVDYQLEPSTGSLFIIRHISGLDSSLNLVQIVATYEHQTTGIENLLFSGRAQDTVRGVQIGGNFFTEQGQGDGRFSVAGIDVESALPRGGRFRAELPYSHGVPDVNASINQTPVGDAAHPDGLGAKVDVEQPISPWHGKLRGSFLHADQDFRNPFSSTITPGAQYAAASAEFAPRETSRVRVGAADERYNTTLVDASRTTVSGAWSETILKHVTLTGGYDGRHLEQTTGTTDSGLVTAAAAVSAGQFEGRVAREQNVRDEDDPTYPDQTTIGARYKLRSNTNLFYTQRISDSAIVPIGDFTGTGFSALPTKGELNIGVESRVLDTTQVTSRYQIQNGINGVDAFAVVGAATQVALGKQFSGTFGLEHGSIVSGSGSDYTSGTVGIAWLDKDRYKATARYEANGRDGYSGLLTAGFAARIWNGLTGLTRTQWLDSGQTQFQGNSVSFLGALALRPLNNDRTGVLLSYQYFDRDATLPTFGPTTAAAAWRHRLSTDGYVRPLRRLELYGKLGWEQDQPTIGDVVNTFLGQGRLQFTISRWIDAAFEERVIWQRSTDSDRSSAGTEIGFWPIADLRLALGYHFQDTRDPYGRDLQGSARGIYGTVSTKLSRLFNLMGSTPPK